MHPILKHWERFGIYVLLMMFGIHTAIFPLTSLKHSSPLWATWLLGFEFFASGAMLLWGWLGQKATIRTGGLVVLFQSLATIASIISAYGGWRSFGFACLLGAFALQALNDLIRDRSERKSNRELQAKVVAELDKLVEETNGNGETS